MKGADATAGLVRLSDRRGIIIAEPNPNNADFLGFGKSPEPNASRAVSRPPGSSFLVVFLECSLSVRRRP
jgi:hypothetical protein